MKSTVRVQMSFTTLKLEEIDTSVCLPGTMWNPSPKIAWRVWFHGYNMFSSKLTEQKESLVFDPSYRDIASSSRGYRRYYSLTASRPLRRVGRILLCLETGLDQALMLYGFLNGGTFGRQLINGIESSIFRYSISLSFESDLPSQ